MCGLVGIIGDLEFKDEATLRRLLVFDVFRGLDSTGVAFLEKKSNDSTIVKIASHPIDLFDLGRFTKALQAHRSSVFLGHNRAATKGAVNSVNAHPFEYGDIIGAHNGTLEGSSWADLNKANGETTDVDSQAIFLSISQRGIEETVKMLQGAWALTWIDKSDRTFNFIKNDKRPLWWSKTKDNKKLFWASEWPMINAATKMSSQGYDLWQNDEGYTFFPFEDDHLYSIDIDSLINGDFDFDEFKGKEIKGKEVPVKAVVQYSGGSPFTGWTKKRETTTFGSPNGSTDVVTRTKETCGTRVTTFNLTGSNSNPFASVIDLGREKFVEHQGCSWCHDDEFDIEEPGVILYERGGEVLCSKCSGITNHNRVYVEDITVFDTLRQVVCD